MKKWEKIYLLFIGIGCLVLCVGAAIKSFSNSESMLVNTFVTIVALVLMLAVLIFSVLLLIEIIKSALSNIGKCKDDLWSVIDEYKKGSGKTNGHYLKQIEIINLFYKEGGKVDELIEKK